MARHCQTAAFQIVLQNKSVRNLRDIFFPTHPSGKNSKNSEGSIDTNSKISEGCSQRVQSKEMLKVSLRVPPRAKRQKYILWESKSGVSSKCHISCTTSGDQRDGNKICTCPRTLPDENSHNLYPGMKRKPTLVPRAL